MLATIYQEKQSLLEELLEKDNSVSIHHRNLQPPVIETYKIRNS